MAIVFVVFFFLSSLIAFSQYEKGSIDTMYSVSFGNNTNFGQSSEFFPKNIFGFPDSNARFDVPSSNETQICALGLDGTITVGFKGKIIRDMPGKDFTIFENAFEFLGGRIFIEPAIVQVSKDGENFITFPFDSMTLAGCAGTIPTAGNENPFDIERSGGNSFDLADIEMDSVVAIRIIDVSSIILNSNHPLYSPIVNGFDLDAVVAFHLQSSTKTSVNESINRKNITLYKDQFHYNPKDGETVSLYTLNGRKVLHTNVATFSFSTKGTYLLIIQDKTIIQRDVIQIY